MALLATSCTMRNKPSLLLDKGPEYLRTRTNGQMFEHRRKSAVELLAASRPQYVKSAAVLDSPAGLTAGTPDRHFRSICQPRERPAPRSKSEFDISKLHELLTEDEADSNCAPGERSGRKGSAEWRPLSAEGEKSVAARSSPDSATAAAAPPPPPPPLPPPRGDAVVGAGGINRAPDRQDESQRFFLSAGTANTAAAAASTPAGPPPPASSPPPLPAATAPPQPSAAHSSAAPAIYTARPIYINLSHSPVAQAGSTTAARTTPGSSAGGGSSGSNSGTPVARGITVLSGGRHLPSPSGHLHHHQHHHQHHHLSSPPESRQPPLLLTPAAMSEESSDKTPTNPTGGEMGPPPPSSSTTTTSSSSSSSPSLPQAEPLVDTERSRGVAVVTSSPSAAVAAAAGAGVVPAAATTTTTTTTTTSASSSSSPGPGSGPRVSMRSSGEYVTTVSGLGSGGGVSQVPRSFSDIACYHSRAGSDVSSEASRASRTSRASRASAGANLEKFFNEMGMERDILDPLLQLQQQQQQQQLRQGRGYVGGSEQDLYESLSSLDSHDARSICSALSRSEKEISTDAESYERSQHQTSIVERNARIIKWLCSVKKAKTPAAGLHQGSAAS